MRRIGVALVVVSSWLVFAGTSAQAATTKVAPAELGIWQPLLLDGAGNTLPPGDGGVTFVVGPPGQPAGVGSARLATAAGHGDGSALLQSAAFAGTALSAIRALSYSTYVTQTNGTQLPFLRLAIDLDGNGTPDDQLFFEPIYQSAGVFGIPAQPPIQIGAWQTWDARAGGWWSVNGVGGATPGAGVKTLDAIVAAAPAARIVNPSALNSGLSIGSGVVTAANAFDGNVDALTVDTGNGPTTFDFEPGPAPAVNGTSAIVRTVSGTVTVTIPGSSEHTVAALGENVPVGTIIDATKGTASLTTAFTKRGATQTAIFFDGEFTVRQPRGTLVITDIILRSPAFARLCKARTSRTAAAPAGERFVAQSAATRKKKSKKVVSRLWGDGKGRFRTRGRNSAATVAGTRWLTEERCDGTLTRVRRGKVKVKNAKTGKTVTITAGHSYLAPN
jgi:hypothetical protein